MNDISEILNLAPYSLDKSTKRELLDPVFSGLCHHHYEQCEPYRKMMDALEFNTNLHVPYGEIPFLPVRLFKMFDLFSVPREEIVKTLTSSGTTGLAVSKIFLNKTTSANQTRVLSRIVASFLGPKRLPMIIIDSAKTVRDRNHYSARSAGIMGFSMFGSEHCFALNDQMEPDLDGLLPFIEKHKGKPIFVFGFTFIIYQHFLKELIRRNIDLELSKAILFHGGGWKKLAGESVSNSAFRKMLRDTCSIDQIHDYYGMAEQTGSLFMECEEGYFHAPVYADIIVRRAHDFSMADFGEKGIVQVLSILPGSYPGHSLLTEDEGVIVGEDDCKCGRLGKYFRITGRLQNAEIRGCSDTYANGLG